MSKAIIAPAAASRFTTRRATAANFTMFFPDLSLVVSAWGGNYADRGALTMRELIPQHVLPAIVK